MTQSENDASAIVVACRVDCAHFIHEYVVIDNAQPGDDSATVATMPFHLWTAQRELLSDMQHERLLLLLKARQLGISWLVCAYALWLCLFHPGRLVLMFSIGQAEANEMLRRVKVMYWRLPKELRTALDALEKENTSELAWANGSRVESLPTTRKAGSGYTASLVILDEFAKNQWDKELYTAVKPTIDGGGKMIILSSANGTSNLFYEMCQRAQKGLGRFVFRFLPWQARPGRDDAWYAAVAADAVQASLMGQEYPATPEEAFSATNSERFLPSITLWDACQVALDPLDAHTPLVLAADAGVSNDHFALVGVTRWDGDGVAVRYVQEWAPKNGRIDFAPIEEEIRRLHQQHNVVMLTYDPYQLAYMAERLSDTLWCDPFSQVQERLTADKQLLDLIMQRRIVHDGNAELRQHLDNADRKVDAESHKLRIVKRKDELKIDITISVSMGAARALALNI